MHINILKEAVKAYPHNDTIQNTVWATALSTPCSICDNQVLNQPLWLHEHSGPRLPQVCYWQEIATEPCQKSSKVKKTPETEKMAWKCVFWDLSRGLTHFEEFRAKCKIMQTSRLFRKISYPMLLHSILLRSYHLQATPAFPQRA